MSGFSQTSTC
ncbi:hypothetical protein D039_1397A, partial [Vibrio parahaemolyticus EKP-028]